MKRSQLYFALKFKAAVVALVATAGCGGFQKSETNVYQIPWPDESGTYHLQHVTIESFDQPANLQGRYVQVMVNPTYKDGQLQGEKTIGRFTRTRDGVMVPTDYTSIEAAAVHAHFERFAKMDAELSANSHWPARVAIDINLNINGKRELNNAFYTRELDAFFIPPFTALDVPVAVNGGALAHEHFHMIFQDTVLNRAGTGAQFPAKLSSLVRLAAWIESSSEELPVPLASEPNDRQIQTYNAFYMSALNEGLADFWAWVYTGDPEFIKPSFPKISEVRRLDGSLEKPLDSQAQLLAWTQGQMLGKPLTLEQLKGSAYVVGTTFARFLYKLTQASSAGKQATREERMKAAAALIKSLPAFAEKISVTLRAKELINPSTFWATLYPNLPSIEGAGGGRVCRALRRFAASGFERETELAPCLNQKSLNQKSMNQKTPVSDSHFARALTAGSDATPGVAGAPGAPKSAKGGE